MTPRHARTPAVLIALLAAMLLLSGCQLKGAYDLPLPGKQVGSSDGYQITADFDDVVNVVPRTVVMANDVPVGQVDAVSRVGWHARVVMTIRNDIVLPKDAEADVRQTSLLGEKYVQLSAPAGSSVATQGRLAAGDHIPLSRTRRNPEVEEVLGALSFLLSGGGVGQLKTISSELNKALDGRQADVRDLLHQLDALVGSLDSQKDDIIAAMDAVNRLTATLNRERRTVSAALDSFGPALRVLNGQHAALVRMLRSLDRLGVVGTRVIRGTRANLVTTLRHLAPTLRRLADAGNALPHGVMDIASFPFPQQAATLAKGDYSNALFAMDFDLDKVLKGALHGGDTGLPNVAQLCDVYAGAESCGQLMSALCSVLKVNVFCAPVPPGVARPGRTRLPARHRRPGGPKMSPPLAKQLGSILDLGLGTAGVPGGAGGGGGGLLGLLGGGS